MSNCQSGYIELFMEKTGCASYVTDHLCPGDTGLLKADNIRRIVDGHGLKYPVYVGDTVMDRDACLAADCPFVFAAYGFGTIDGCEHVIGSPEELPKILIRAK